MVGSLLVWLVLYFVVVVIGDPGSGSCSNSQVVSPFQVCVCVCLGFLTVRLIIRFGGCYYKTTKESVNIYEIRISGEEFKNIWCVGS